MTSEDMAKKLYEGSIVRVRCGVKWEHISDSIKQEWLGIAVVAIKILKEESKEVARQILKEIVESGFLYGPDCKNDDFACYKCGGDIRGNCCQWAYEHEGNKAIAQAIRDKYDITT